MKANHKCEWTEDSDGTWNTDCKSAFVLNDGNPAENGFKFCCYCGGQLIQNDYKPDNDYQMFSYLENRKPFAVIKGAPKK